MSVALIVGSGDRFLSGISYYTALLTTALGQRGPVALLLLRRLCPQVFYPGRRRVGKTDGAVSLPDVPTLNGLDWFWGLSAWRTWRFWRRNHPDVVILQWWTATVLHSYVVLAWLTKRTGARLVIEMHEVQDVGEASLPMVSRYTRVGMRMVLSRADAVVVHSDFDRHAFQKIYPQIANLPTCVIPVGPFGNHMPHGDAPAACDEAVRSLRRPRRQGAPVRLLMFGVVRPYKGHAELAGAVRLLMKSGLDFHLSVVGEVWQGYRQPLDELEASLPPDRLTVVDRYVAHDEVPGFFADADLVIVPYRRASASGVLLTAMAWGLPVVTTSIEAFVEVTAGYTGAVLVPPRDPAALADGIRSALPLIGTAHADPYSWSQAADRYAALLDQIGAGWGRDGHGQEDLAGESSLAGGIA
ncbi:glycosyltransferase family 4 protein [Mycobacterium sp. NPDC048908]|uniref:glycosyltransferase family 4 protein n=1 Tax=Mycobacterium sp. NPDC048908 TaxID=3364292 RepID=UPI003717399B